MMGRGFESLLRHHSLVSMRRTALNTGAHVVFDHANAFERRARLARRKHLGQAFAANLAKTQSVTVQTSRVMPETTVSTSGASPSTA